MNFGEYPLIEKRGCNGNFEYIILVRAVRQQSTLVLHSCFYVIHSFYTISISALEILNFGNFSQKRDRKGGAPTDRRTDTPSYRDARTHLKKCNNNRTNQINNNSNSKITSNSRIPQFPICGSKSRFSLNVLVGFCLKVF